MRRVALSENQLCSGTVKAMPVTVEENNKYRDFVSRIATENGCFDFQPDQVIWHYTDGPGLVGILESSRLHATQISALNDAKETRHSSELFIQAVRELINERAAETDVVAFLNTLIHSSEENVEAHVRSKFFVVCFSGAEDDLTQWERLPSTKRRAASRHRAASHRCCSAIPLVSIGIGG